MKTRNLIAGLFLGVFILSAFSCVTTVQLDPHRNPHDYNRSVHNDRHDDDRDHRR